MIRVRGGRERRGEDVGPLSDVKYAGRGGEEDVDKERRGGGGLCGRTAGTFDSRRSQTHFSRLLPAGREINVCIIDPGAAGTKQAFVS